MGRYHFSNQGVIGHRLQYRYAMRAKLQNPAGNRKTAAKKSRASTGKRKKQRQPGLIRRWFTRTFWPTWFGGDNVFPSADHVPFLHRHFEPILFEEHKARVPYMVVKAPYYQFIGRKREAE